MKTKIEYVQALRALADKLEGLEEKEALGFIGDMWYPIDRFPQITKTFLNRESLLAALRGLGGKWTKTFIGKDMDQYSFFNLVSDRYPVTLSISRDRVCEKIVTYKCEPMFKPEEEKELEVELAETN